jgi:ribosomal RNA-processing protein 12
VTLCDIRSPVKDLVLLGSISSSVQSEVTATVTVFASSENREVVKSALGYLRVAVMSLPQNVIRPQLGEIIPVLLSRTHDQKNPFKSSVLRIFSQMIKRYGYEEVRGAAGDEENTKVLSCVRKRAERARKKRASKEAKDDGSDIDGVRITY